MVDGTSQDVAVCRKMAQEFAGRARFINYRAKRFNGRLAGNFSDAGSRVCDDCDEKPFVGDDAPSLCVAPSKPTAKEPVAIASHRTLDTPRVPRLAEGSAVGTPTEPASPRLHVLPVKKRVPPDERLRWR